MRVLFDRADKMLANRAGFLVRMKMPTDERQTTHPQATDRDRELYEKSLELRMYSSALLWESRSLCHFSRKLRVLNRRLAASNPNPTRLGSKTRSGRSRCGSLHIHKRDETESRFFIRTNLVDTGLCLKGPNSHLDTSQYRPR